MQYENHVVVLTVKTGGTVNLLSGFKRLRFCARIIWKL